MNFKHKKYFKYLFVLATQVNLMIALASCGGTAFNSSPSTQSVSGSKGISIPPEVDILLVVDDTGAMYQAYPAIQTEFPAFMTALDSLGFNYHATIIPMTTFTQVTQVVGSIYDYNSSNFTPAFPGDNGAGPGSLPSSVFRSPTSYSAYINQSNITTAQDANQPTFQNLASMLATGFTGTNFFRTGSQPIIIFVGNGNDTSGVNFCKRSPDNVKVPCEQIPGTPLCTTIGSDPTGGVTTCGSEATSLNYYESFFSSQLPGLKVYSVVANEVIGNCLGGASLTRIGYRYEDLASFFNSKSLDLCTAGGSGSNPSNMINAVLTDMSSYLVAQKQNTQVQYLIINPNEVPSQVTRLIGGDSNQAVVIPQDPAQPLYWSYVGSVNTVNTGRYTNPNGQIVLLNPASGNAIQFHIHNGGVLPTSADTFLVQEAPPGSQGAQVVN